MKQQTQTAAAESGMTAKKTQHQKIVAMVQIALFAAIIAVCSWIQIPMTVPFTMQTFAVFCALATLGGKGGTISILIYIVLGAVGVPVFAGFTGGIGILFGTTGGYIIGFLFTGLPVCIGSSVGPQRQFDGTLCGQHRCGKQKG